MGELYRMRFLRSFSHCTIEILDLRHKSRKWRRFMTLGRRLEYDFRPQAPSPKAAVALMKAAVAPTKAAVAQTRVAAAPTKTAVAPTRAVEAAEVVDTAVPKFHDYDNAFENTKTRKPPY